MQTLNTKVQCINFNLMVWVQYKQYQMFQLNGQDYFYLVKRMEQDYKL